MMLRLRTAVALIVGALVLGTSAAGAQAPPEGVPPLTVTGSPVEPGGTIVVSGEGCRGGSAVMIGVLDALAEGVLVSGAVMPGDEGAWSSTLQIPASTGPGVYPVSARCTDYSGYDGDGDYSGYSGYDGYDGYNGSGSFDYVRGTVTVLPPRAAPSPQGDLTVTPNVIPVGGSATVTGSGWRADEQITLAMYSTPVVLGQLRSGPDGSIEARIQVPVGTALGTHTVCAMNATAALNPVRNLCAPITVIAAAATPVDVTPVPIVVAGDTASRGGALAFTGLHPWQLVLVGLILLALGAELYRRNRRTSSAG